MDIIAHRGASGEAPENTLAAFELAWQQQADGIELDVHLSRDDRVMAHHDPDTRRCAGVDLRIAETDSGRLRELDVGVWKGPEYADQRMPFLEEVLATVPPGRQALIEIKCGPEIAPALAAVLHDFSAVRVVLISFRLDCLLACRSRSPDTPCYYLAEATGAETADEPRWGFDPALIELARSHALTGLDLDCRGLDADFAGRIREAGLGLLTWTVNDPDQLVQLHALGVAGVTTDWPLRMRHANPSRQETRYDR